MFTGVMDTPLPENNYKLGIKILFVALTTVQPESIWEISMW